MPRVRDDDDDDDDDENRLRPPRAKPTATPKLSCPRTKKYAFATRDDANLAAWSLTRRSAMLGLRSPDRRLCSVYLCKHCALWHVTSRPKKEDRQ